MALIILAGGKSSRMGGGEKGLLQLGEETMVGRIITRLSPLFSQIILVVRDVGRYNHYPAQLITDQYPGCGPISGIHAGLKASQDQYNLVVACDQPLVKPELVSYILEKAQRDVVVPKVNGGLEPLLALYSKDLVPIFEEWIIEGKYKLQKNLPLLDLLYLAEEELRQYDPDLESFLNINTPEDYHKLL